ncbi:MAG: DMT family transporter [Burkholderiaceae bacterium]
MTPAPGGLAAGLGYALAAGLLWGMVFVAPAVLHDYPPVVLSIGRYLAFGLIAAVLAIGAAPALKALRRADWIEASKLSLVGNLLYYSCLASAIQLAGPPLPTLVIGTLPLVIAVCSNRSEQALPWRRLWLPLLVIAAGLALVNADEFAAFTAAASAQAGFQAADGAGSGDAAGGTRSYVAGALLALGAVACWTWYPIRNARWLRQRPGLRSDVWATAQGLTTLPLAAAGGLVLWAATAAGMPIGAQDFDGPLGPRPALFIAAMLLMGLLSSWAGTLCWNRASQLLPTSLVGQLIVFETLSALALAFAWRAQWPPPATAAGIAALVLGVVLGVRAFQS